MTMSDNYGSTKFLLGVLLIGLATGLLAFGLIGETVWLSACSLAVTTYAAANVIEKRNGG